MDVQVTVTLELRSVTLGIVALVGFGIIYNAWVASLEQRGHHTGYISFLVAGGCAAAIVAFGLMVWSLELTLLLGLSFIACGLPMIIGSVRRYVQARAAEEAVARSEARKGLDDA